MIRGSNNYRTENRWIKVRYIQMALMFLMMGISYAIRTILSVAIVAMTDPEASKNADVLTFDWKNTGVVLSSFYWSYAALQFFAGHIGIAFGPRWILTIAMFVNALASLMIPTAATYWDYSGVVVCRLIQGVAQGFIIPLTHSMLGKWAPTEERSWLNTSVYSGCSIGTILSMPITGYLSSSWWGWPSSFYFFGILGLVWCVLWLLLGADSPATHRSISMSERVYIEQSLGQDNLKDVKIPWKAIITSLPYWAIIAGAIGEAWGSTFLITEIPTYISKVTDIDIEKNGLFSSAPYIVATIFTLLYGPLADYLILKGYTSRKTCRRLFHAAGAFIPSLALVWLAYEETPVGIAILLIVAITLNGAMFCGHNVNHIDISPRFSGVLFGISNGIGQTLAIFAPLLVDFIVLDETDKALWRTMFIIAAVIYAGTAAFFIVYLSADRQWWDSAEGKINTEAQIEDNPKLI
ncbi:hypothetical protein GWI33_015514 [Rhynchophorus ferrugineus]|nr:hypothetical protein GWI33_015514 [Rhynchophorus ferrugineus]